MSKLNGPESNFFRGEARKKRRPDVLLLASGSPRRMAVLKALGIPFAVVPHGVAETVGPACCLPVLNAVRKCEAVAARFPEALVLGADTVIELDGEIMGKPANRRTAVAMLTQLSGRKHLVLTGVCLRRLSAGLKCVFCEQAEVEFKSLSAAAIKAYTQTVDTLDKAGAYAIQEHGDRLIRRFTGSYENILGLPKERLAAALSACGFTFPGGDGSPLHGAGVYQSGPHC